MFYWTKEEGRFSVGKGGISCDTIFQVTVADGEVVIVRKDRTNGKVVKEETRKVSLIDFVDVIHKLWHENEK
jgi:hypothetical protein